MQYAFTPGLENPKNRVMFDLTTQITKRFGRRVFQTRLKLKSIFNSHLHFTLSPPFNVLTGCN